jgi:hypothetical protein
MVLANMLSVALPFIWLSSYVASQSTTPHNCELVGDVIGLCESLTPGFTTMAPTVQAGCICGSTIGTISWGSTYFDEFILSCVDEAASMKQLPRLQLKVSYHRYMVSVPLLVEPMLPQSLAVLVPQPKKKTSSQVRHML